MLGIMQQGNVSEGCMCAVRQCIPPPKKVAAVSCMCRNSLLACISTCFLPAEVKTVLA